MRLTKKVAPLYSSRTWSGRLRQPSNVKLNNKRRHIFRVRLLILVEEKVILTMLALSEIVLSSLAWNWGAENLLELRLKCCRAGLPSLNRLQRDQNPQIDYRERVRSHEPRHYRLFVNRLRDLERDWILTWNSSEPDLQTDGLVSFLNRLRCNHLAKLRFA